MEDYLTDKKANATYRDGIDDIISDAIEKITEKSEKHISEGQLDLHITDITSEVREIIIKELELIGCDFLYVDEEM